MAKSPQLISVECPCCQATLHIDPQTKAVIRSEEHVKPPSIADLEAGVAKLRSEVARREEVFQKSVENHKSHADVLNKKFDEMLRLAKENPDAPPPKRDIDFD
ncbi:MAG: hypothetical protein ABL995_01120 [Bryobacteraceae bacterium]